MKVFNFVFFVFILIGFVISIVTPIQNNLDGSLQENKHNNQLNEFSQSFDDPIPKLVQSKIDILNSESGKHLNYRFTFTSEHGKHFTFIATNMTQYLFLSAFTELFSYTLITRKFFFNELEFDIPVKYSDPYNDLKVIDENEKIIKNIIGDTNITQNGFVLCQELTWDWNAEILLPHKLISNFNREEKQLLVAKSFRCCNNDLNCNYEREKWILTLVHIFFVFFKFAFVVLALSFITKARKFIFMKREHCTHVTNSYYDPPFWLTSFLPNKKWAYSIRNWAILYAFGIIGIIFLLNFIHILTPVDWDKNERSIPIIKFNEIFNDVQIGTKEFAGPWFYALIMFPISIIGLLFFSIVKLCSRHVSWKQTKNIYSNAGSKDPILLRILLKIVRGIISIVFGASTSLIIFFVLLRAYDLHEYNDIFILCQGYLLFIYCSAYYFFSNTLATFLQSKIFTLGLKNEDAKLADSMLGNDSKPKYVKSLSITLLLRYFVVYELISLIIEFIFYSFFFFSAFLASSVICRQLWTIVVLFILNPDDIQFGVFVATVGITFLKFFNDLSKPYTKIRVKLLEEKPLLTSTYVEKWNPYIMSLNQDQIHDRFENDESCSYYIFLSWEKFFKICTDSKVDYFVKKVITRAAVSLTAVFIFFMGFVTFAQGFTLFNSEIAKLIGLSFVPLLPKIVEVFEGKNLFDDATFELRFKSACSLVEYSLCPPELSSLLKEEKGKLGIKPSIAILQYKTVTPKENKPPINNFDQELTENFVDISTDQFIKMEDDNDLEEKLLV